MTDALRFYKRPPLILVPNKCKFLRAVNPCGKQVAQKRKETLLFAQGGFTSRGHSRAICVSFPASGNVF